MKRVSKVVACAAATLGLFGAVSPAGGQSPEPQVLFPSNCIAPKYQPVSVVVTCADVGLIVKRIKWSSWTTSVAIGTGVANVNLCEPSCVDGKRKKYPAKLVLSKPKLCANNVSVFTSLRLAYTGKKRPPGKKSFSTPFPCPENAP